ncbi:hypothetical protein DPMN_021649 [Dreissena polymorpha]|uniref:C2H2-type domain-containing protein n=1 Tax=Dreissena polymorpha TaxID=45954 RepID=A0A9D4NN51_DREPO|nr:hypothetical protein DPMN_021649 [Dreissena polymorpha]
MSVGLLVGRYIDHDLQMTPIDFEVTRSTDWHDSQRTTFLAWLFLEKTRVDNIHLPGSVKTLSVWVCEFCNKKFYAQSWLVRHRRTHTGERPFTCEVCERKFSRKHHMLDHMKRAHAEKNDGEFSCGNRILKAFAISLDPDQTPQNVASHQDPNCFFDVQLGTGSPGDEDYLSSLNISPAMPSKRPMKFFLCTLCVASLAVQGSSISSAQMDNLLALAQKSPAGQLGLSFHLCPVCGKTQASRAHLIRHMRVHTGDKPFKCRYCEYRSARADSLRVHEAKHGAV